MRLSGILRCTGAIITVLSILVAVYAPALVVLSLFVGATAAYGFLLLMGGEFVLPKMAARLAGHTEAALDDRS